MTITAGIDFEHEFDVPADATYFSPGRINLIGEHTDYNAGWVLPMAVQLGNRFMIARSKAPRLRIVSSLVAGAAEIPIDDPASLAPRRDWTDYFAGVLREFTRHGIDRCGLNIAVVSSLPTGSGMSSSASITVGLATVLNDVWRAGLTPLDIARLAQSAENAFVGVACGILDPFAVAMGNAGHVIALDCATLDFRLVPFPEDRYVVIAADTGVPRRLAESRYNERRDECRRALELIRQDLDVATLSELTVSDLMRAEHLHADTVANCRARHVVTENERVQAAIRSLQTGNMASFGALLVESHDSLRRDFEVSCKELDIMVDIAMQLPGVVGAKMTGGGFGGSVVAIVDHDAVNEVTARLAGRYRAATRVEPRMLTCRSAAAAGRTG